mmetsp:Transcript_38118/g.92254  ORF Transcript_38118/g.92254 Transcript_38118/m.92254 type:complete len:266 (-) Transcript_38118:2414-3211(-)|eukprot:CAMPEP_0113636416 /NCGR_PEP_ID=MMETSP0017_2-20120614/19013_1 /TAXON_ID=2856 /ORGANISM="Cylindrotheca closterium" /LENGTH=265 /DNA_ID=CAMNT_0000547299 /DNA_START=159 /DNA_END=956 /DNA_ORIENTATION=+ /assembly_acc=CAM_ASM_000147
MDSWLEPSHVDSVLREATLNETWKIEWNVFNSINVMNRCKNDQRKCIGGPCRDDRSKITCGISALQRGCVVYSIGGCNQWEFELDILAKTPCSVHTFDCTRHKKIYTPPESDRLFFHHICLGTEHEEAPGNCSSRARARGPLALKKCGPTWTLDEIRTTLGHHQIDMLKMDIEGWEWDIFESWPLPTDTTARGVYLPMQIAVELHTATVDHSKGKLITWSPVEVAKFHERLLRIGYVVIERDDNMRCSHCSELTLIRARCPASAH